VRGRKMSDRMGHCIDDKKYNKLLSHCVFEHIKCVVSPEDYEE
jgi:hypothetical protein